MGHSHSRGTVVRSNYVPQLRQQRPQFSNVSRMYNRPSQMVQQPPKVCISCDLQYVILSQHKLLCPAKNEKCRICGRINHIIRACAKHRAARQRLKERRERFELSNNNFIQQSQKFERSKRTRTRSQPPTINYTSPDNKFEPHFFAVLIDATIIIDKLQS